MRVLIVRPRRICAFCLSVTDCGYECYVLIQLVGDRNIGVTVTIVHVIDLIGQRLAGLRGNSVSSGTVHIIHRGDRGLCFVDLRIGKGNKRTRLLVEDASRRTIYPGLISLRPIICFIHFITDESAVQVNYFHFLLICQAESENAVLITGFGFLSLFPVSCRKQEGDRIIRREDLLFYISVAQCTGPYDPL